MAHYAVTWSSGWNAYFTPVAGGDLSYARYSGADAQYVKLARLASQMQLSNFGGPLAGIQAAMWDVDSPSSTLLNAYRGAGGAIESWDNAWSTVTDFNPEDWCVVNDVDRPGGQEFLTYVSVVPEPVTLILMGAGLIAVAGMTVVGRHSVG